MSQDRRPAAFRLEPTENRKEKSGEDKSTRKPQAVKPDQRVTVTPPEHDVFESAESISAPPPPAEPSRRRFRLGTIFTAAFGLLVTLALGLWTERVIRDLFSRADWLGWVALGLAVVAFAAVLALVMREVLALSRLASVESMRRRGNQAYASDDAKAARAVVSELSALLSRRPETAAGRRAMREMEDDIIDGRDLLHVAERELLAPIDARARKLVLDAAKRVSVVTAVSPRAVLDVGYVLFEAARLLRRLAELYCGRPGFFGFLRLSRNVLAHMAVTGSMAMGETMVQQIVGHGIAARLSAKAGEGMVNGMLTARIGIAAMDAIRPLAFRAVERPGVGDFLKALAQFAARSQDEGARKAK